MQQELTAISPIQHLTNAVLSHVFFCMHRLLPSHTDKIMQLTAAAHLFRTALLVSELMCYTTKVQHAGTWW